MNQLTPFQGLTPATSAGGRPSLYDLNLPTAVMNDVALLRRVFEQAIRPGEKAARHLATLCDGSRGRSVNTLYRLLKEWVESGKDDLKLIDKRKFPGLWQRTAETALPEEFLQWVAGRFLGNQRGSKAAWRDILAEWKTWRRTGRRGEGTFPGYDVAPPPSGTADHPAGWSYKNLMDRTGLSEAEKVTARIGTVAAKAHRPTITGTRQDARWLEWVFFDDVWHDRKVVVPGYREPVRLLQLGCLDLASGCYLKFGLRPELPRDDGTRERLKRRDMLLLVASLLLEYGFPTDYVMHLVVERATATLTLAEAQLLYDLSGGQIQVGYTGMEGAFVLAWEEEQSGNPQAKGPLESWHNLFANYQGSLPGQVGKDRNHQPAALLGSDREAIALAKAQALLPEHLRASILFPYPTVEQAHQQTLELIARINDRRDHAMDDFQTVLLWRVAGSEGDWQEPAALVRAVAAQGEAILRAVEYLPVLESPRERAQRLSAASRIAFIPPGALVRFYEDSHYRAKITAREVAVTITQGKRRTLFVFGPERAEDLTLPDGAEVLLHFDPLDGRYALVTHRDVFVGAWPRHRVRRGDSAAVAAGMARSQSFLAQTVASVRGKQAEKLIREQRRMEGNLATLAAGDLVPQSALTDLASGREVRSSHAAEGMQAAVEEFRAAAEEERAAARENAALAAAAEDFTPINLNHPENTHPENDHHLDY